MRIREFNFSRDWDKIAWKETMWLNFMRAVCVTPIYVAVQASESSSAALIGLLWPIYYFMAVPILLFVIRPMIFLVGGPLAPLVWIPLCLMLICGGDPIVFLISKIKPQLVPIQGFKFINFELFIFVEKPENRRNGEGEMMDSDY